MIGAARVRLSIVAVFGVAGAVAMLSVTVASAPVVVSASAVPTRATVGDRITLTITVEGDASTVVESAGFGANVGSFEIVAALTPSTAPSSGGLRTTFVYTLTAFRTGDLTIPPQSITYSGSDGSGTLTTNPITVSIESVLAPGDGALRPLKPQIDLADPAPPPVVPVAFVAGLAGLTAFGFVLMGRAAANRPVPTPIAIAAAPRVSAEAIARASLDAIAAADTSDAGAGEYYARIAATIRGYLSARYAFPAFAMTRSELERNAAGAGIERWSARLIANLLEECNAVEFAEFRPAPERRAADLTAAYEIVALGASDPDLSDPSD